MFLDSPPLLREPSRYVRRSLLTPEPWLPRSASPYAPSAKLPRPSSTGSSIRNAAGYVYPITDTLGCLRLHPMASYLPEGALVLENPTDTAGIGSAFVRGYIHDIATPLCGETRVFYLVSRN